LANKTRSRKVDETLEIGMQEGIKGKKPGPGVKPRPRELAEA